MFETFSNLIRYIYDTNNLRSTMLSDIIRTNSIEVQSKYEYNSLMRKFKNMLCVYWIDEIIVNFHTQLTGMIIKKSFSCMD